MWRTETGRPRSDIRMVTWCRLSGDSDQKSHIAVGERMLVRGWRFLRMDEVREFEWVADEEYRRVVANDVPVAFLGVQAQRKAANVAFGIGSAVFACDR